MTKRKVETRTVAQMPSLPEDVLERIANTPKPGKGGKQMMLSPKEWAFVQEYVTRDGSMTRTEAAIRAGYTPNAATDAIKRLLDPARSPHVVAAVNELRNELAEKYGTTFERHMRDLQVIRDQALAAGAYGAAVQAEYRRGQALGTIYIERKEIRHGTIDSMSRDEVMRKLEEIKKLYGDRGGPVIDITPVQIAHDPEVEDVPEPVEPQEEDDASEAGSSAVQETERQPTKLPFHPD